MRDDLSIPPMPKRTGIDDPWSFGSRNVIAFNMANAEPHRTLSRDRRDISKPLSRAMFVLLMLSIGVMAGVMMR